MEVVYRYDGSFEGFLCCVFDSYADARAYVDRLFADCGIYDIASIGSTRFAGRKFYPRAIGNYRFPNDHRNDYPVFAIRIC